MVDLIDIETEVLYEMSENLTTAENWSGDDELREGIGDALDEACMIGEFHVEEIVVNLKDDVAFYSIAADGFHPLYVRRAHLLEQDRRLYPSSIRIWAEQARTWLVNRGSPIEYAPLSPTLIAFWPCYSSDGGAVKLDVVCCPSHYSYVEGFLTIREELENALIHYGKYHLLMRTGRSITQALTEFQEYLKGIGAIGDATSHAKAMRHYMLKQTKEEDHASFSIHN